MSGWRRETGYLSRYAGSGIVNTLLGFAVIFLLMWLGASPYIANAAGFFAGLISGFFLSRRFVFRSGGHFNREALRYLAAFFACYLLNVGVLKIALDQWALNPNLAQILAAGCYTGAMYLATRLFVFDPQH